MPELIGGYLWFAWAVLHHIMSTTHVAMYQPMLHKHTHPCTSRKTLGQAFLPMYILPLHFTCTKNPAYCSPPHHLLSPDPLSCPPTENGGDPLPVNSTRRMRVLFGYNPVTDSPNENKDEELCIEEGDVVTVFGRPDEDRYYQVQWNPSMRTPL